MWTAERINVLFGVDNLGDPRNIVLGGDPHPLHSDREGVRCSLCQIRLLWLLVKMFSNVLDVYLFCPTITMLDHY